MPLSSLVLALALAAAPDAGTRNAPFSWDVPGLLTLVPVGSRLEHNGLPIAVYSARSKWKLNDLLEHYARRFAASGFYLPSNVPLRGLTTQRVVALDDVKMVSFLVYGWQDKDGTTTLMLGAADLGHRKPAAASALPAFPGAKHVANFNLEQGLALSFTAQATEAEVIDFYRSVLPSGGWREREPGVYVRDERAVKVLAKKDGAGLSVVVLESFDEGAISPPGP